MEDIFLVMQLYSYPGDYLIENPNVERLAETLDKFEEDILQLDLPRVRGSRRAAIRFGEPIAMKTERGQRTGADDLTEILQAAVQAQVNALSGEATPAPQVNQPVA